jgi:hypothetical protein
MKTIKTILAIAILSLFAISCSKDDDKTNSPSTSKEGIAAITLTAGGQTFTINGPCGWASAGGTKYIGANQSDNNLKVFAAYFNIQELPTQTTTYALVEDVLDTNPNHITMNITEMTTGTLPKITQWNSSNYSGNLKLVVEGNKVSANLAGIILKAGKGATGFINGNTGAFAANGTLSGTLTFYRN